MIPVKFRHELPLGSLVIQGMFLNHHIPSCLQSIPFKNKGKSKKNNHFGQKIYQIGHFASAPAAPIGHFMLATC